MDLAIFCSECGAEATGKFCWSCGAPLRAGGAEAPSPAADAAPPPAPVEWDREDPHYATVVGVPAVRALLAREAAEAATPMTGEEFIQLCEKALPLEVPLGPIVKLAGPLSTRMGIKTGRAETRTFPLPAGRALVGVLASLARHGNEIRQVEQAEDGCVIHAALPSTMWHGKGDLVVAVSRTSSGASVEAATKIPGQLFDWGKSKSRLETLFEDVTLGRDF